MKLKASKEQLGLSPEMWLRRAGYALLIDRKSGQVSFARRLRRDFYPRFHIYFIFDNSNQEEIIFNLHLDQKRPGYQGYSRHNAEYDGEVVARELERLRSLLVS